MSNRTLALLAVACASFTACSTKSGSEPWSDANARLVKAHALKTRDRTIPNTAVPLGMEAGKVRPMSALPKVTLAPGVTANLTWGKGLLLEWLEMAPGAAYPAQQLNEEVITEVREGAAAYEAGGKTLELAANSVLYLTPGTARTLKAGPAGMKALEVFSPVRADLLKLAGVDVPAGANFGFPDQGVAPSLNAAQVYRLDDIQLTPVTDPDTSLPYKRSSAYSRLVWGRNVMLSFIRMDPNSVFPVHIHPEDQLMTALRGSLDEGVMDVPGHMSGEEHNTVYLPGGMVHSAKMSELGGDALDIFWPVRPDYKERAEKQAALYDQVVAPDARPVKLAGGFTFTEGPTWLHGKLYFSDMYFKDPANGDWTGSPARSQLIAMDSDGKWKALSKGAQTNGTIASKAGNLLVCDMFGHRVIEVDPATGKTIRTVLDKIGGKPIDGPNDLVMDAKGGVYISDPQFNNDTRKSQPGTQVYYVAPDGSAKVVIPAGEYAMPNGVEISPDGRTFYVNNTWHQPGENFLYAYDVQSDGSLTNRRKFAELHLTGAVLSAPDPADRYDSRADGMAVDMDGRIYVATLMGVQVFDKAGVYVGCIWVPQHPVNLTFGGKNGDVLYMVGDREVWSIQTKVKGFRLPAGLN
ncbi:MAG TPA: SMP-30/gluconolactonase/LRE family protein [Bryobacteraceae bacterium]|nr:SMP-30/gluconolactonase/LRE family protein [Bryobacteraceae bacterium]